VTEKSPFFSLDQVADRLKLHVRTVRAYVRTGRLRAIRIGKQYRVSREDLESLIGTSNLPEAVSRRRNAEVSSVVQMDAVTPNMVLRIADHLRSAVDRPRDDGSALRIETIYDQGHAQLKVIVIGSLSGAATVYALLGAVLDA
jgi:excisionase family DNA binding protein